MEWSQTPKKEDLAQYLKVKNKTNWTQRQMLACLVTLQSTGTIQHVNYLVIRLMDNTFMWKHPLLGYNSIIRICNEYNEMLFVWLCTNTTCHHRDSPSCTCTLHGSISTFHLYLAPRNTNTSIKSVNSLPV